MLNKFNVFDFIMYTKKHPLDWIQYCEVLIDPDGAIILCRPSHIETAIEYAADINNTSKENVKADMYMNREFSPLHYIVGKYGLVAVWYGFGLYSNYKGINDAQRKAINNLKNNKLISEDFELSGTNEYNLYLDRYGEKSEE